MYTQWYSHRILDEVWCLQQQPISYHTGLLLQSSSEEELAYDPAVKQLVNWDSSGWVIPKTQKIVLDATLLNTQHYKVQIQGKVEWSSILLYTLV